MLGNQAEKEELIEDDMTTDSSKRLGTQQCDPPSKSSLNRMQTGEAIKRLNTIFRGSLKKKGR
jgi:hypothetical protein